MQYDITSEGDDNLIINKVEICGVNTPKLPILKEKEKRELLLRMRDGIEVQEKYL